MKALLLASLLGILPFTSTLEAQNLTLSETVTLTPLLGTFVPRGFTEGDRAQFAIHGTFSNSCYRLGPHALRIDEKEKTIFVQQQAYFNKGICLQVVTPFTNIVEVGELSAGDYKIIDVASDKEIGNLVILKAEGSLKTLCATVTEVELSVGHNLDGSPTLTLKGEYEDRCTLIKEVQVEYQENVIVVKPLVETSPTRCVTERSGFSKSVELKSDLRGMYLVHVRSGNGLHVNKMVKF